MLSSSPEAIPTSFWLHPYREQYSSVEWVLCEHHSRPQETKRNKPGIYALSNLSRTSLEQHAHIKVCAYVCVYIYTVRTATVCNKNVTVITTFSTGTLHQLFINCFEASEQRPAALRAPTQAATNRNGLPVSATPRKVEPSTSQRSSSWAQAKVALEDTPVVPENLSLPHNPGALCQDFSD